jgi:hypothetical protein
MIYIEIGSGISSAFEETPLCLIYAHGLDFTHD